MIRFNELLKGVMFMKETVKINTERLHLRKIQKNDYIEIFNN